MLRYNPGKGNKFINSRQFLFSDLPTNSKRWRAIAHGLVIRYGPWNQSLAYEVNNPDRILIEFVWILNKVQGETRVQAQTDPTDSIAHGLHLFAIDCHSRTTYLLERKRERERERESGVPSVLYLAAQSCQIIRTRVIMEIDLFTLITYNYIGFVYCCV